MNPATFEVVGRKWLGPDHREQTFRRFSVSARDAMDANRVFREQHKGWDAVAISQAQETKPR